MTLNVPGTVTADYVTAAWTAAATTGNMNKPTSLADNDVWLSFDYDQVAGSLWNTRPTGWAEAYHATQATTRGAALNWKAVTTAASEPSTVSFGNTNSGRGCAISFRVSGAKGSNPFDAVPTSDVIAASSATMTVPGVTVTDPNALSIIFCFANGTGSVTHTPSAPGHTLLSPPVTTNNAGSTSSIGILVGTAPVGAAGATGNITVTWTASDSVTVPASLGGFRATLAPAPVAASGTATITFTGTGSGTAIGGATGTATIGFAGAATAGAAATATAAVTFTGRAETPAQSWVRTRAGGNQIIGHRGGAWGTYGEETRACYNATANWLSTAALEISFWVTTDGVYVASHDQTTGRVFSGTSVDITTVTWASISSKTTLVAGNPIATVDQIIADHPGRIFVIENKSNVSNSTRAAYIDALCSGRWISKCYGPSGIGWCNSAAAFGAPAMAYFFPTDLGSIATPFTGFTGSTTLIYELADYSSSGSALPVQTDANTFYTYTQAHSLMSWASVIDTSTQRTSANSQATTAGSVLDGYMMSNVPGLTASDASTADTGTGSITVTATATPAGRATGTATISFAGTGTPAAPDTATAAFGVTATGTGQAAATGTAAITFAGTGTGRAVATATGSFTFASTGTGVPSGGATATVTFTGLATPGAGVTGTASATFTGTATGSSSGGGAGTAAVTFTAAGTARAGAAGTAAVTVTATATPAGSGTAATGTASATFTAAGTARAAATGAASVAFTAAAHTGDAPTPTTVTVTYGQPRWTVSAGG